MAAGCSTSAAPARASGDLSDVAGDDWRHDVTSAAADVAGKARKPLIASAARRRAARRRRRRAAGGGSRPADGAVGGARHGPRRARAASNGRAMRRPDAARRPRSPAPIRRAVRRCAPSGSPRDRGEADLKLEGPPLWRRSEPGHSAELADAHRRRHRRMEPRMRRLLTFACGGAALGASLDAAAGRDRPAAGHRRQPDPDRLAPDVRKARQGAGGKGLSLSSATTGAGSATASGEDPGFRGSGPDLAAAAAAFRREAPRPERMIGFGLCDGATALALLRRARPGSTASSWSIPGWSRPRPATPAAGGDPRALPPAAAQPGAAGRKCFPDAVNYRKLFKGLRKVFAKRRPSTPGRRRRRGAAPPAGSAPS